MAYEPDEVKAWLRATLAGDTAFLDATPGGVHEDVAPPDTPTPYVTYQVVGGSDDKTAGARNNALVNLMIKVVNATGAENATGGVALSRIEALLESARWTNAAGFPVCVEGSGILPESTRQTTVGVKRYLKSRGRNWIFTVATL